MTRAPSFPARGRTLRTLLDERRALGGTLSLREAVSIIVPLSVELAQHHAAGERFYVHPSALVSDGSGGFHLDPSLSRRPPANPKDAACLAPEERSGNPGDARASVFSVGTILYEACTAEVVGPGMRRPSEVVPGLPEALDLVLAKALVSDPVHRPDDLKALAVAIHHLSPADAIAPPSGDPSRLDHDEGFDVDVSLSMVPPLPKNRAVATPRTDAALPSNPYAMNVRDVSSRPGVDQATGALTELKHRLESDPRPRYVVVREGMDHGPFNAVELLQQIASNSFTEKDLIRDTFSQDERLLVAWPEFAPFAEHARRHRDIAAEKVAIEKTVESEKKSTRGKALFGLSAVGLVVVAFGAWIVVKAGTRRDDVAVQEDTVTNVETTGNLNVKSRKHGKGHRVVGEQGGVPILAGGMSCEAAQAAYVEEINIGGAKVPADITSSQYGAILNGGSYLNGCGLPSSTSVSVCVAVQAGHAVGVTVRTKPSSPGVASCIASHVRGISFPSHPKLDVTRTTFAAQ